MSVYNAINANATSNRQDFRGQSPSPRMGISNWLHPRLKRDAILLMEYIRFHAWKIIVRRDGYCDLASDAGICDAYAVSDAVGALYRLGCLEIRPRGDIDVLQLIDGNIDRLAVPDRIGAQ